MKQIKITPSIGSLILANLVPLFGVILFDWDAGVIVLLYWTENIVIGMYNILKMAFVKMESPFQHLGKLFTIPFFCLHYGGFCAVHGLFLLTLFKIGGDVDSVFNNLNWPFHLVFLQLLVGVISQLWKSHPYGMEWPVLALVVSHGISFVQHYLISGENRSASTRNLMSQPYKRIVILHVAIIAGGMPIMLLGSPIPLLFILVILKIIVDIRFHIKSHQTKASSIY